MKISTCSMASAMSGTSSASGRCVVLRRVVSTDRAQDSLDEAKAAFKAEYERWRAGMIEDLIIP
jgi:hypothetical protein